MFIIIPLILIVFSLGGIFYILNRKMPYLKKLSTSEVVLEDDHRSTNSKFFGSLFPEAEKIIKKINFSEYKKIWGDEFEKFVRRINVVSLKIGNFTNSLLNKIRKRNGEIKESSKIKFEMSVIAKPKSKVKEKTLRELKREEHDLILEVAKDPKNASLYKKLGDIYIEMDSAEDAYEAFSEALRVAPDDLGAKRKLNKLERHL